MKVNDQKQQKPSIGHSVTVDKDSYKIQKYIGVDRRLIKKIANLKKKE